MDQRRAATSSWPETLRTANQWQRWKRRRWSSRRELAAMVEMGKAQRG
jgi:hypothetical protein